MQQHSVLQYQIHLQVVKDGFEFGVNAGISYNIWEAAGRKKALIHLNESAPF